MMCIDLFCGLGGWAQGFLAEGYRVIGFDLERHDYGTGGYPGKLVIQDVLTLHGSQFRNATCIVASPPCQKYSYMAMPWKRAKAMAAWYRESPERIAELNALFDACFRIQREASEAAGRYIPMVVENVKGAQPWVGPARWHFGSYYLWGDVPALMPFASAVKVSGLNWSGSDKPGYVARAFNDTAVARLEEVGRKVPMNAGGRKIAGYSDPRRNGGRGVHLTSQRENSAGIKQAGHSGRAWFADPDVSGHFSSKSDSRKAASAQIAKIPFPLANHIARVFAPSFSRA